MTKEQLLPLAKTYFDSSPELKEIFGTEDQHFWYKEIQAKKYCKMEKQYFRFTPEDFEKPKSKSKANPKVKPAVKSEPKLKKED